MDELLNEPLARRTFLKWSAWAAGVGALGVTQLASAQPGTLPKNHPVIKRHRDTASALGLLDAQSPPNAWTPKDYSHLLKTPPGLSTSQLGAHLKLYENYVNKANLLHQLLDQAEDTALKGANPTYSPYREMLVELSFAQNGVVLHELYFGNLGPALPPTTELKAMAARSFGSWQRYLDHLLATGRAMRGWALTVYDLRDGQLRNIGLDQHNQWSSMLVYPILALDVYEHAYMMDFGTDRERYLQTFLDNLNWQSVHKRLMFAVHHLAAGPHITD